MDKEAVGARCQIDFDRVFAISQPVMIALYSICLRVGNRPKQWLLYPGADGDVLRASKLTATQLFNVLKSFVNEDCYNFSDSKDKKLKEAWFDGIEEMMPCFRFWACELWQKAQWSVDFYVDKDPPQYTYRDCKTGIPIHVSCELFE